MGLQVVLRVNIERAALSFDSKLPKFKQLLWVKHGWRSEVTANVLFENIVSRMAAMMRAVRARL